MRRLNYSLSLLSFLLVWSGVFAQTKIFGTTTLGGAAGAGVLYSMNTDGTNYQLLHSFGGAPDGAGPTGRVVPGPGGKLYGFTPMGGVSGYGIIYSWDTVAQVYQKVADLDSVHAAAPAGDPLFFNGLLYGLGRVGGPGNSGTIFSYDLTSGTLTDVYDCVAATGIGPFGSITVWNNIFFFENIGGGAFGNGDLMSFNTATGVATDLYDFGVNSNSGTVSCDLLLFNNMLYGTTVGGGGSRLGCIFSLDPRTGAFRDLFNFVASFWGQFPGSLAVYHGILYGTANEGGVSGTGGTLFSLDPVSMAFTKLYDWQSDAEPFVDGAGPVGPVAIDSTGMLFGQTFSDGPFSSGIIYNYNINTASYNILFGFSFTSTGGGPRCGFILQ